MHRTLTILRLAFLLLISAAVAQAKSKPLDDSALDQVTAGGFTLTAGNGTFQVGLLNPTTISFTGKVATSKGMVEAIGTMTAESETAGETDGRRIQEAHLESAVSSSQGEPSGCNLVQGWNRPAVWIWPGPLLLRSAEEMPGGELSEFDA